MRYKLICSISLLFILESCTSLGLVSIDGISGKSSKNKLFNRNYKKIELDSINPILTLYKNTFLYKIHIDAKEKQFSGLLFIKLTDKNVYRVVCNNEIGVKFFDLEFQPNKMIVHNFMDIPFKEKILNTLEKELRLILMNHYSSQNFNKFINTKDSSTLYLYKQKKLKYYYYCNSSNMVNKIEIWKNNKLQTWCFINNYSDSIPSQIIINEKQFKIKNELTFIER